MIMVVYTLVALVAGAILARSYQLANADHCPDVSNIVDFSKAQALTWLQKLSVVMHVIWTISISTWLVNVLGHQVITWVVILLLAWWAMVALLDLLTWWLPHIYTHPLWFFSAVAAWLLGEQSIGSIACGGIVGFGTLWFLNLLCERYRSKPGFGGGDLYLSGALGSWFGWYAMPNIWLIAALVSLVGVVSLWMIRRTIPAFVPFGPGLGVAASVTLLMSVAEIRIWYGAY